MQYKIVGDTAPAVEIQFDAPGETMVTQSGGMAWMSDGIKMSTNTNGGVLKGLGRALAGESIFMANYTAETAGSTIAFASSVVGDVMPFKLDGSNSLICQKGAFLCSEKTVDVKVTLNKKVGAGFFGGEGFILQKISGTGMVFLEIDGDKYEKELAAGEVIKVDTGNVVAFEESVSYDIETVKGVKNIFLGGEGLFVTKLTGPGKVVLQTQNVAEFAGRLSRYIVKQ